MEERLLSSSDRHWGGTQTLQREHWLSVASCFRTDSSSSCRRRWEHIRQVFNVSERVGWSTSWGQSTRNVNHMLVCCLSAAPFGRDVGWQPLVKPFCPSWPSQKPDPPPLPQLSSRLVSHFFIFCPVVQIFLLPVCVFIVPVFSHGCMKYWCGRFSLCFCLVIISAVDRKKKFLYFCWIAKREHLWHLVPTKELVKRKQLPKSRQRGEK